MKYIIIISYVTKTQPTTTNNNNNKKSASQQEETVKQWTADFMSPWQHETYASKTHKTTTKMHQETKKASICVFTPTETSFLNDRYKREICV